jgi:hypothetical protein
MEPVLPQIPMRGWSILTTIENFVQQERPQCGDTEAIYATDVVCVKLKPSQSVSVVTGHPMPLFPLEEVPQSL